MCQHIFEGRADGVTCRLCGYHMTPQEYAEYLRPSAPEEPENAPAVTVGPVDTSTVKPMTKRARKKKEATTNE